MTTLTRAHNQLFSRTPDTRFGSLDELYTHCKREKEESADRWVAPEKFHLDVEAGQPRLALNGDGAFSMSDWSFTQVCRMADVQKDTVNRLSPETASQVLMETLPRSNRLVQAFTFGQSLRSLYGVSYTRLYNANVLPLALEFVTDFEGVQEAVGGGTGLHCDEQDRFAFLIGPLGWIRINGEAFAPGLFLWKSKVGRQMPGVQTFWFRNVCHNHLVWDAVDVAEVTRKHTTNVHDVLDDIHDMPANLTRKRDQPRVPRSLRTANQSEPLKHSLPQRDMAPEETVRWILSTYDLPERLEKRLTWIAVARLEELFLTCFDDQYRYIDSLVDRFTRRNWEWREVSLDALTYEDGRRSLQELIPDFQGDSRGTDPEGGICWNLGAYYDELPDQRSLCPEGPRGETDDTDPSEHEHTLRTLRNHLDPVQYEFVEHLLQNNQGNGYVCESFVTRNLEEIQRRLDELAAKYQVDGRIVFPPQPILDIRFHPLRIRFGRRSSITRNPLRHWRRYRHIYRGLRRKDLFRIDQSLYQALRAAHQLDQVIPETYRRRSMNRE
jgi:hypothetical protein